MEPHTFGGLERLGVRRRQRDLEAPGRDSGPRHHDHRRSIGQDWRKRYERIRDERGVREIRLLGKTQQLQAGVLERRAEHGVLHSPP